MTHDGDWDMYAHTWLFIEKLNSLCYTVSNNITLRAVGLMKVGNR